MKGVAYKKLLLFLYKKSSRLYNPSLLLDKGSFLTARFCFVHLHKLPSFSSVMSLHLLEMGEGKFMRGRLTKNTSMFFARCRSR